MAPAHVVDGRMPTPFVPDFAWRPGINDYPVALMTSSATMRRKATIGGGVWDDIPVLEEIERPKLPVRYIPHALAIVAIVAVVMSNSFWLDRSPAGGDEQDETPVVLADDDQPNGDTQASLLDSLQQPGQGGNVEEPTATSEAEEIVAPVPTVTPVPVEATSTPEPEPTEPAPTAEPTPEPTPVIQLPGAGAFERRTFDGERLIDIAGVYGLSIPTLLWPNDIDDPAALVGEGVILVIPPVNGVLHTSGPNDTIESIAARYGVEPEVILEYWPNELDGTETLFAGQPIMVPGGKVSDWGVIREYTVRPGDNLWLIADYFGLTPQTLAWANMLPRPELIGAGQVLTIPPGDGALIVVEPGDSVEAIASRFNVEPAAIRTFAFNNLGGDRVLREGQYLLVPGAALPELELAEPSALDADSVAGEDAFNPATGWFIWPTAGYISQEFHAHHNGLDIANKEWTPINAADGGIVIFAGWNDYGLGWTVGVDHGNGYQTWYGHLVAPPFVEVGQVVWQGGYLGGMGSTGKSTGPHLHFVVMKDGVYQNPLSYLQH